MLKLASATLCATLVLSSCATNPPVPDPAETKPARLAPPPAEVMVNRPANYLQRLCAIFSSLSETPIAECSPSPPAKPSS